MSSIRPHGRDPFLARPRHGTSSERPEMRPFLRHLPVPVLIAAYPIFFLYQVNAAILAPRSILLPLAVCIAIAALVYILWFAANGQRAVEASNAAVGFLASFLLYGSIYEGLLHADVLPADHHRLLPVLLLLGLYAGLLLAKLRLPMALRLQQVLGVIVGGLILYNLAGVVAVEYRKSVSAPGVRQVVTGSPDTRVSNSTPDIYYIILDEFASFHVVREYWHYDQINRFETYLKDKGFFVASTSRSRTASTMKEVATRLNYQYPERNHDSVYYSGLIAHNEVMQYLSSLGYTTVVFDGAGGAFAFPGKIPIEADYTFEYVPASTDSTGIEVDEFAKMVFDRTMLRVLTDANQGAYAPMVSRFKDNILYTFEKVADLADVPSPKFVFAHIMLPHMPFVFDESGRLNDTRYLYNWNYYLGSYVFATRKTQELIDKLLRSSDPGNPPIIIIQSDHGARNMAAEDPDSVTLPDYPDDYKYEILNALLLPGLDTSLLAEDFAPINTFPLIFNTYFGDELPLE